MYSINFTVTKKKFCLSLNYSEANSYLFLNGIEMYKFRGKDSEIMGNSIMFRKCFKRLVSRWYEKTGFNGYIYDFSVDYNVTNVNDIKDIHKYLIKKNVVI